MCELTMLARENGTYVAFHELNAERKVLVATFLVCLALCKKILLLLCMCNEVHI